MKTYWVQRLLHTNNWVGPYISSRDLGKTRVAHKYRICANLFNQIVAFSQEDPRWKYMNIEFEFEFQALHCFASIAIGFLLRFLRIGTPFPNTASNASLQ